MGRRERPISADEGPVAGFAARLRRLRADAGSPTYRQLSDRAHYAPSVLSTAAGGSQFPTWPVTLAFVLACGGAEDEWRERWRAIDDQLEAAKASARETLPPVRGLPAATGAFTGRGPELTRLLALGGRALSGDGSGAVVISAIGGMAGIGKTALALRAGHLLAADFPDGQLFIDLRGYTQGAAPREASEALAIALASLGLSPEQIPADLDARAARYRDRLSATRTLIVLDNAADEAQVRPLLPGAGRCLVLITSRRRLRALDDALALTLEVLPEADAVELLCRVGGIEDGAQGPLLREIARLCGRLPLALRIAAALLRHRPSWSARDLADRLRAGPAGLEAFFDGDRDLATVFDLSYQGLDDNHRLLFRRLGAAPGTDIDASAAAALVDSTVADVRRDLEILVDHNLVDEAAPGRYRLHDLLRVHARSLAGHDPADQTDRAVDRLLHSYLRRGREAQSLSARLSIPGAASRAAGSAPGPDDRERALSWLRIERANLAACLRYVAARGRDAEMVAFTAVLAPLLRIEGAPAETRELHLAAAAAAGRLGDPRSRANALFNAAGTRYITDDHAGALRDLDEAMRLYRDVGDELGQANVGADQGLVRRVTGDLPGAVADLEDALRRYSALDDRLGRACALMELGSTRYLIGDLAQAVHCLEESFRLYGEVGHPRGRAGAASSLGGMSHASGDRAAAMHYLDESLRLNRSLGNKRGLAAALVERASVLREGGDLAQAMSCVDEGLRIYRELGHRLGEAIALVSRGVACHQAGDLPAGLLDLERAIDLFRGIGARGNTAWALNIYAPMVAVSPEPARTRELFEEALSLALESDMQTEQAAALEGIGTGELAAGDAEAAAGHLAEALAILQRLGLPDADRVEKLLADLPARN